jgi:hypothetical protein
LLHTSHTPLEGLLEKTKSILAEACEREKSVKLPIEGTDKIARLVPDTHER